MGGEGTSVGEGKSGGVTRRAVTDGWGASSGRVGGDGGQGWDFARQCQQVEALRGTVAGWREWLVCKRVGSDDYAV